MPTLTDGQRRTLYALRELTSDGWPATVREVAAKAGFSSVGTAHYHLVSLEQTGHAIMHPRAGRRGGWKAEAP